MSYKNQSGFNVKVCPECNREININSFVGKNCSICHEDINDIKIFEVVEGDYNDVFSRQMIRATNNQIEKYILDSFLDMGYKKDDLDDLGSDSIGYQVYYEQQDDETLVKHYIEAVNVDRDGENETYKIDIDLTEG